MGSLLKAEQSGIALLTEIIKILSLFTAKNPLLVQTLSVQTLGITTITNTHTHTQSENSGFQMLLHPYRLKNNSLAQGSREEAWSESKKSKTSYTDGKIIYSTISRTVGDLNTICKLHARDIY